MALNQGHDGKLSVLPAHIFELLAEREEGLLHPLALQRAVRQMQAERITLNANRKVEKINGSIVRSMVFEEVEDRYMLCGYEDGSLAVFDTQDCALHKKRTYKAVVKITAGSPMAHKYGVTGEAPLHEAGETRKLSAVLSIALI